MSKDKNNEEAKIIPFPNLSDKLAEKGMEALQQKQFENSLQYFEQLLDLEPKHFQANFGKAISLVELGMLEEAAYLCEQMLKEGIGEYFEVLQVYASILVQLEKYETIVNTLEVVIQEEKLPPNAAEYFYQLLEFSRKMVEANNKERAIHSLTDSELKELNEALHGDQIEKQLFAINNLSRKPDKQSLNLLKNYLKDEEKDPVLKSIILQKLAEQNINEKIKIHKFSKEITVNPSNIKNTYEAPFSQHVIKLLGEKIENENPSLYDISLQIWSHYLFSLYPFKPNPLNENLWAAAVHFVSCRLNGFVVDPTEVSKKYNVENEQLMKCVHKIFEMEKQLKGND